MKALLLLALCSIVAFAQDEPRPIVLAPALCDTIYATERDQYSLLPQMTGFERAIFFLNADSTLRAHVFYVRAHVRSDTTIQLHRSLLSLRNQIAQIRSVHGDIPSEDPDRREDRLLRDGDGRQVVVEMRNRAVVEGELLAVRNGAIVVNTGVPGDSSLCSGDKVTIVDMKSMRRIMVPADNPAGVTILGVVVGAAAVGVIGGLIGMDQYNKQDIHSDRFDVPYYLFGGIAVGAVLGYTIVHEGDKEWDAGNPPELHELRKYSRYSDREPSCLRMKQ